MDTAGDDEIDASDWLAGQFEPTEQVPQQPAPAQPAPAQPSPPAQQVPPQQPYPPAAPQTHQPFGQQPPVASPAAAAPVAQPPLADPPSPNTQGGFNWGLRPGGAEDAAPQAPVQSPAPQQPAAQQPPAQQFPPQAPAYQAPPPEAFPPQYEAPTTPYVPPVYQPQPPTEAYPPAQPFQTQPAEPVPPVQPMEPAPTAPFSWEDFAATQAPTQSPAAPQPTPVQPVFPGELQPTEAYTVQPWQPTQPASSIPAPYPPAADEPRDPTSAIDALFGEQQFQEYEEVGVLKTIQTVPGGDPVEAREVIPREPLSKQQRILMIVAGGLVAVLALVALFLLGTKLGSAQAAPAPASTAGSPSAAPTSAATGGTAAPGVQPWTALQGGECIQPWTTTGVWAATFTVVDCAADHQAEMVFKGTLPDAQGAPYPTGAQFATEITPLCSAPTAINYATASAVTDLQVSFSYPANASAWDSGARTYYCFVSRTSSGNLPGDLSVKATQ